MEKDLNEEKPNKKLKGVEKEKEGGGGSKIQKKEDFSFPRRSNFSLSWSEWSLYLERVDTGLQIP